MSGEVPVPVVVVCAIAVIGGLAWASNSIGDQSTKGAAPKLEPTAEQSPAPSQKVAAPQQVAEAKITTSPLPEGGAARGDVDRLTTYAVLLGRGIGCGLDVSAYTGRVGAWVDRIAPPGSSDQQLMMSLLMEGMRRNAQAQQSGQSPDGCATVARAIRNHPWP